MDINAITDVVNKRRLLKLAGAFSLPIYVAPVGFFGLRGVRPRLLRNAISGAIVMGLVSIATWGLSQWSQSRRGKRQAVSPRMNGKKWQLPVTGPILPDEAIASAASGH